MACCASCGSSTGCGCGPLHRVVPGVGTAVDPVQRAKESQDINLCNTLGRSLLSTVDNIRDLYTTFGLRPYSVQLVRTKWSVGFRNQGTEIVVDVAPLLPTPKISDMSAVTQVVTASGLDEFGDILLSEVSGLYTEDQLRGRDADGRAVPADENFYYEIEFPPPCIGRDADRRRFTLSGAPMYFADRFQWNLRLTRQRQDRARNGDPR